MYGTECTTHGTTVFRSKCNGWRCIFGIWRYNIFVLLRIVLFQRRSVVWAWPFIIVWLCSRLTIGRWSFRESLWIREDNGIIFYRALRWSHTSIYNTNQKYSLFHIEQHRSWLECCCQTTYRWVIWIGWNWVFIVGKHTFRVSRAWHSTPWLLLLFWLVLLWLRLLWLWLLMLWLLLLLLLWFWQ